MAKGELLRSEVPKNYQWDLSTIYGDVDEFNNEFTDVEKSLEKISQFKNKIMESSNNLLESLKLLNEISRKLSKLYVYASMKSDEDTTNTENQKLRGKVNILATKASEESSFFTPELLKSEYSIVEKYLEENEDLKEFEKELKDIYRFKPHTLSEKEEKIISSLSDVLGNSSKTSNLLRDSDMTFKEITDEEGNKVKLSNLNYKKYIESTNRDVRKEAFQSMYESYSNMKNTLASTLEGRIKLSVTESRIRGFKSSLDSSLFGKSIDSNIYHNLIATISKNLNALYKYYDIKKELLGLDELHLYDTYAPLIGESAKKYTFEEAKELVLKSLEVLGQDYVNDVSKAFSDNWIDVYPNRGKRSGAYSWGSYDTSPFVLLNYNDTLDDVSTLTHELGHSMHSYYSKKHNPYQYSQYEIFVAEVASTVNELLLFNYMLNNSNEKSEKLVILNEMLEMFRGTLFRQTMFAEFELDMHRRVENDEVLTHDVISDKYYELNKKYFGPNVVIDEEIKFEWSRIPHFYTPFYVYQYATGISAACFIVENILNNREGAVESYLEFLKTGGRDFPVELLKIAGVDMNDPSVIESAINLFNKTLDEFYKLYKN